MYLLYNKYYLTNTDMKIEFIPLTSKNLRRVFMKKNEYSVTLSICHEKIDKQSKVSVSLKTSSKTKSNLQTQNKPKLSLIFKQLISFVLINYKKIFMFYPLIKSNICIDLFIFLFIENILK